MQIYNLVKSRLCKVLLNNHIVHPLFPIPKLIVKIVTIKLL